VHQEGAVVPHLTIGENVMLTIESRCCHAEAGSRH
jgi:ABC-type nitrate/sulfonate/bicarbonate transport system ATPase subunit